MRRSIRFLAAALVVVAVSVPVALAGAEPATGGSAQAAAPAPARTAELSAQTRAAVAESVAANIRAAEQVAAAARADATPPAEIVRVRPGHTVTLRAQPHGAARAEVTQATEFGSPQSLGVVRRQGRWLGVTTAGLPNGSIGWVHSRDPGLTLERTRWSIHADVSRRRIVLRRDGRTVRRLDVAVGRPDTPTPTGRFAVTDKLSGGRFSPYYGCCVLAISATQPHTPPGWTGGNRMAIHGTSDPSSIGSAASAGCLRAADDDLQVLMDRVPLGTPVVVTP
jgi:lipoprotein-anchoring transpeptidase ErfK/SrfK